MEQEHMSELCSIERETQCLKKETGENLYWHSPQGRNTTNKPRKCFLGTTSGNRIQKNKKNNFKTWEKIENNRSKNLVLLNKRPQLSFKLSFSSDSNWSSTTRQSFNCSTAIGASKTVPATKSPGTQNLFVRKLLQMKHDLICAIQGWPDSHNTILWTHLELMWVIKWRLLWRIWMINNCYYNISIWMQQFGCIIMALKQLEDLIEKLS